MAFRVEGDGPIKPTQKQDNPPSGEAAKKGSNTVPVGQSEETPKADNMYSNWVNSNPSYEDLKKFEEQNALALGKQLNEGYPEAMAHVKKVKKEKYEKDLAVQRELLAKYRNGQPLTDIEFARLMGDDNQFTQNLRIARNIVENAAGFGCSHLTPSKDFMIPFSYPPNDTVVYYDTVFTDHSSDTIHLPDTPNPPDPPEPPVGEDGDVFDIIAQQLYPHYDDDTEHGAENQLWQDNVQNKQTKDFSIAFSYATEFLDMERVKEDNPDPNVDRYTGLITAGYTNSTPVYAQTEFEKIKLGNGVTGVRQTTLHGGDSTFYDNAIWEPVGENTVRVYIGDGKQAKKGAPVIKNSYKLDGQYMNKDEFKDAMLKQSGRFEKSSKSTRDLLDFGTADMVLTYEKRPNGKYYPMCYVKASDGSVWEQLYTVTMNAE